MNEIVKNAMNEKSYLRSPGGFVSWLMTLDSKRISLMTFGAGLLVFLWGLFALSAARWSFGPAAAGASADISGRLISLHGQVLWVLFLVPVTTFVTGNLILPLQAGARNVAFPKMNLLSFYLWLAALAGFFWLRSSGIPDPILLPSAFELALKKPYPLFMAFPVLFASVSCILTGVNFIVTLHCSRAEGMTWNRLPAASWGIYSASVVLIAASSVLASAVVLAGMDSFMKLGLFDPALGGKPLLIQHFLGFYFHVSKYAPLLTGFGIVTDILIAFSRKKMGGLSWPVYAFFGVTVSSFLGWSGSLLPLGASLEIGFTGVFFSLATGAFVMVCFVFWFLTLSGGLRSLRAPAVFVMGFLVSYSAGALLSGVMAFPLLRIYFFNTSLETAALHYSLLGGALMPILAGLHYWWPKFSGRMYNERIAVIGAFLITASLPLAFLPLAMLGLQGSAQRAPGLIPGSGVFQIFSSLGMLLFSAGLAVSGLNLIRSLLGTGAGASDNPWNASSLEWTAAETPPYPGNFLSPHDAVDEVGEPGRISA